MANNYINTNKISASQLCTWIKSPKNYIEQYIEGKPFIGNKYTIFGSKIHKDIELDNPGVEHIPKLKNREFYFEKSWNECVLNGYLDSHDIGVIFDYKVAKKDKWNKEIVDKDNQIKFYGLWHLLQYGTLPRFHLIHIESDLDNKGNLYLTGTVNDYIKDITEEDTEYIKEKIEEFIIWCNNYRTSKQ